MQPVAGKLPPVPRAGFATGNEAEEGRAVARYVHTPGSSSQAVGFTATSREGEEFKKEWKRAKLMGVTVDSLKRCERHKEAQALSQCGQRFAIYAKHSGEVKLRPYHCDSPFCPACSNRRARPLIKKLKGLVNKPDCSYWHLLLSVPNVTDLMKLDVLHLQDKWSELWNHWVFQEVEGADGKPFRIFGAVRSIEVTYNEKLGSWHLHIHVVFEAPKELPGWWLILLKAAWNQLTGGEHYVNLQRMYSFTKRGKKRYGVITEKALKEVCKYVTKSSSFAANHLLVDEFLTAFKGIRRIQCCGSFYGREAGEPAREPGEDENGISDSSSDVHFKDYFKLPFDVPIGDTVLLRDGSRQLSFAYAERVREHLSCVDAPWELSPPVVPSQDQKRIEFTGAMPEKSEWQPSLFEGVA
jgi:plasmid rolling circle replication initiator protein Rep